MQRIEGEFGEGAEGGRDTARKEAERVKVISLSLSKFMNLGRVSRYLPPICSAALAAARLSTRASVANRAFGAVQISDGWAAWGTTFHPVLRIESTRSTSE